MLLALQSTLGQAGCNDTQLPCIARQLGVIAAIHLVPHQHMPGKAKQLLSVLPSLKASSAPPPAHCFCPVADPFLALTCKLFVVALTPPTGAGTHGVSQQVEVCARAAELVCSNSGCTCQHVGQAVGMPD